MSFDNLPSWRDGAVTALRADLAQILDALCLANIDEPLHIAMSYGGADADVSRCHKASGRAFESGR
jgi:hypothetical protein